QIELRNYTGFQASSIEVWKTKLLQVFEAAFGAKYFKEPCWRGVPSVVLEPFEFREPFELLDKVVTRAKCLEWKEIKPRSVYRFGTPGMDRVNNPPTEGDPALAGREIIEERELPPPGEHPRATHLCGLFGIPVSARIHACQLNLQTDKL